jgi:hypothetical protein
MKHIGQIQWLTNQFELAHFILSQVQHISDQAIQMLRAGMNSAEITLCFRSLKFSLLQQNLA